MQTNGILQAVLQVMEENHPARMALRGDATEDISPTRAAIELGMTRGYSLYADRMRLLSNPIISAGKIPQPSYEPPPQEQPTL